MTMLDQARDHIARMVAKAEGDDDFMPFMLLNSPRGYAFIGLPMPEIGSARDSVAETMMAMIVIHQATAAVFGSCAWTLNLSPEERQEWGDRDFGEHPDREEIVFTVNVTPDGGRFHHAVVTRENNKVTLGDWTDSDGRMGGRFHDAMDAGITLGRNMPPEMVEFMNRQIEAGNEQQTMESIMRAYRRVRTGSVTAEELAESQRLLDQMTR